MMDDNFIDLKRLTTILLRQRIILVSTTLIVLLVGAAYIHFTAPQFSAETLVFLDRGTSQSVSDISDVRAVAFEKSAIESEVEVVRSQSVANKVVNILRSQDLFTAFADRNASDQDLADQISRGLKVTRVGETYVLSIQYTSNDPVRAATIANAYAEAYIAEQSAALTSVTSRTVSWLEDKIDEIQDRVVATEQEMFVYRQNYNQKKRIASQKDSTKPGLNTLPEDSDAIKASGLVSLKNLQRKSEAYKVVYSSYVSQLEALSSQLSYPITETRIITSATPPKYQSHPKPLLILGAALIFGSGLGIFLALVRDNLDKTLRRVGQVRKQLGISFLGFFPKRNENIKRTFTFKSHNSLQHSVDLYANSVDSPYSLQSETVRMIRHLLDANFKEGGSNIIGIVGVEKNGAGAIVAGNLALYLSQFSRVLLIDADTSDDLGILKGISLEESRSLSSLAENPATFQGELLRNETLDLQLEILPIGKQNKEKNLADVSIRDLEKLLSICTKNYDYVLISLPAFGAAADIYGYGKVIEHFILVAEWGVTLPNYVDFSLKQNGIQATKVLGCVLENADMLKMKKFYGHKI